MKWMGWLLALALGGVACAETASLNPEDLLFEDLFAVSTSFLRLNGLVGTGGLWAAEVEAGTEVAPRTTLSVMAARSQLNSAGTNEFWLNAFSSTKGGLAGGISALYGYGPGSENYVGGLASLILPWDRLRFKVQSGWVHFALPSISVAGAPLKPDQIPLRGEIGFWADPNFLLAAGAGTYFYTVNTAALSSVLATTTQTTGVGILSGFPLNQFYLRAEFYPAAKMTGNLAISSALSAYQTNRTMSLSARLEGEISRDWTLGGELSVSRTGTQQWNIAVGPTLFVAW